MKSRRIPVIFKVTLSFYVSVLHCFVCKKDFNNICQIKGPIFGTMLYSDVIMERAVTLTLRIYFQKSIV